MTKTEVKNALESRFNSTCSLLEDIEQRLKKFLVSVRAYIGYSPHHPEMQMSVFWSLDCGKTSNQMEVNFTQDELLLPESELVDLIELKVKARMV